MPLLAFLASATLATSIGRLMEGGAPASPPCMPGQSPRGLASSGPRIGVVF
eukprot:COSAG06_NODE_13954_length_1202_cov_1.429737_1_plen_50_part_10